MVLTPARLAASFCRAWARAASWSAAATVQWSWPGVRPPPDSRRTILRLASQLPDLALERTLDRRVDHRRLPAGLMRLEGTPVALARRLPGLRRAGGRGRVNGPAGSVSRTGHGAGQQDPKGTRNGTAAALLAGHDDSGLLQPAPAGPGPPCWSSSRAPAHRGSSVCAHAPDATQRPRHHGRNGSLRWPEGVVLDRVDAIPSQSKSHSGSIRSEHM